MTPPKDWESAALGRDRRKKSPASLPIDADLLLRRGLAAFRLTGPPLVSEGARMGYRPNPDSGLPSYSEIQQLREGPHHLAATVEHRPPPEVDSLLARVRTQTEGQEDEWITREASAAQVVMRVEMRWNPAERLLFIFAGKEVAARIFRHGQTDGLWKGKPVEFDLTRLRGDTEVLNTFQAWASDTGRVTTHAFFGNNILEEESVRKTRLSSVRVHLSTDEQEIVVFISADGRINCADDTLDHDSLYGLFQKLHAKLRPGPSLIESA